MAILGLQMAILGLQVAIWPYMALYGSISVGGPYLASSWPPPGLPLQSHGQLAIHV